MLRARFLAAAVLAALLAARAYADQPATQTQPDPHAFDALIQKLGDPSFAVREQAQVLLDQIPLARRDALAAIAEKAADEEIKARLIQHVGMMDERIATDPPPISVDLQDAPIQDVVKALAKATGFTFGTTLPNVPPYTLHAANLPLWEIMRQLSDQHPLWLMPSDGPNVPDNFFLTERSFARVQVFRGFAFMADDAKVAPDAKISLTLNVALDPRIAVIDLHPMQVAHARDNQGHLLHMESEPAEVADVRVAAARFVAAQRNTTPSLHFQSRTVTFPAAEVLGKTLTVKGTVNLLVEVAHTSVDIPNATKHVNEAIAVGDSTVTFREFLHSTPAAADAPANGPPPRKSVGIALQLIPKDSPSPAPDMPNIEITATGGISMKGGFASTGGASTIIDSEGSTGGIFMMGGNTTNEKTRILVTDATGKTIANYSLPRGNPVTSVHIVSSDFQEPLKFTLTYPTRTREAVVPFEFKDIPIKP